MESKDSNVIVSDVRAADLLFSLRKESASLINLRFDTEIGKYRLAAYAADGQPLFFETESGPTVKTLLEKLADETYKPTETSTQNRKMWEVETRIGLVGFEIDCTNRQLTRVVRESTISQPYANLEKLAKANKSESAVTAGAYTLRRKGDKLALFELVTEKVTFASGESAAMPITKYANHDWPTTPEGLLAASRYMRSLGFSAGQCSFVKSSVLHPMEHKYIFGKTAEK